MVCDNCNTTSKILFGTAGVLGLVAFIMILVAATAGGEGLKVDFIATKKTTFTVTVKSQENTLGYDVLYADKPLLKCKDVKSYTTVTLTPAVGVDAETSSVLLMDRCARPTDERYTKNDPPLKSFGTFIASENGAYVVTGAQPMWCVDNNAELGEALSGIAAMMGIFLLAVVVMIISCILCCVGCCCMGKPASNIAVVSVQ